MNNCSFYNYFYIFALTIYYCWKGGVAEGKAVDSFYAVYPIPSDDIGSNENLRQNEGY